MNQKNTSVLAALLTLGIGVFLIIRPGTALRTVVIILSVMLLINGVLAGLAYFNERPSRQEVTLLAAALAVLLGVFGLLRPATFVSLFPIMCGVGFVLGGLGGLAAAYKEQGLDTGISLLRFLVCGLLIALGVVMFINPFSSAVAMTRVLGWFLAVSGGLGLLAQLTGLSR